MAKHEFGIIDSLPDDNYLYEEYEPNKYNCISVHDDLIYPLLDNLNGMDTYFHGISKPSKGLAYCGITLIPPSSFLKLITILELQKNNNFNELINLINKAMSEKKYIIHFGI